MQKGEIATLIGSNVRAARAAAGLSRKRLAEAANVSERYLNDLEKGAANASVGTLARLAEALEIELPDLLPAPRNGAATAPLTRPLPASLAELLASLSSAEQNAAIPVLVGWVEERRRSLRGLALIGLRGAGKSTLGRMLAERHGLAFVSVTREVETRAGMSLADLFNLGGPDAYRAIENEVARDLSARCERMVLETAGGIVHNDEALEVILGAFRTIWLKASPEEHLARVAHQGDLRPMHGYPKALEHLKTLLAQREPDYARAQCLLDTSGRSIEDCLTDLETIAGPMLA
jgi:XRE family aerobic/anaerobic benzoate catabolism transcriptional regulator